MLDIGWQELLVIGALALIVVGPKDLPGMLRKFGQFVGRMRSMAGDFQSAMNDAAREADLANLKELNEVRSTLSDSVDFSDQIDSAQSFLDDEVAPGAGEDDDPGGGPITAPVSLDKPVKMAGAPKPDEASPAAADEATPARATGT